MDRHALLQALMDLDPPLFVMGGVAEDSLLHGAWARPHGDVDVLTRRDDLHRQIANASALGVDRLEVLYEPVPGAPLVLSAGLEPLDVEYSVCEVGEDGAVSFHVLDGAERLLRIGLDDGVFDHPPVSIDGVEIRTLSPLALYQIRAGITAAGGFGPPRAKDVEAQRELVERFFGGVAPAGPSVTAVGAGPR